MEWVRGVVQHYGWGDPDAIPALLDLDPDGRPWAELWLGTHPGGPSALDDGRMLSELSGPLPYLLKVLAAAAPLSLQTHPDTARARAGFEREEQIGRAADSPERIYRDASAKPELLVALTPFDALCGFRNVSDSIRTLHEIGLASLCRTLSDGGLGLAMRAIYRNEIDVTSAIEVCRRSDTREARLVAELADRYPGDPSVLMTLLLHRVRLTPGDAVFLAAGNLHAYLSGTGVEIMQASDNVIRGGLTTKHVDVDELLAAVDLTPLPDPVVRPVERSPGRWCYGTPGTPFRLWRFEVDGAVAHVSTGRELLLCTHGDVGEMRRGDSAYLAPGDRVTLDGAGTVFRVEEIDAAS